MYLQELISSLQANSISKKLSQYMFDSETILPAIFSSGNEPFDSESPYMLVEQTSDNYNEDYSSRAEECKTIVFSISIIFDKYSTNLTMYSLAYDYIEYYNNARLTNVLRFSSCNIIDFSVTGPIIQKTEYEFPVVSFQMQMIIGKERD